MLNNIASLYAGGTVAGNYYSIQTATVDSGGATTITFSSIPSTYTHLQLRILSRGGAVAEQDDLFMRFNSDTGSNYTGHQVYGTSTGVAGSSTLGTLPTTLMYSGYTSGSTATANIFGATIIDILDYSSTNKYKTSKSLTGFDNNGTAYCSISLRSLLWMSTSAISTITLTCTNNFAQYSQFSLYGVK